jgi:ATP:corrinoid adenosyltransferase
VAALRAAERQLMQAEGKAAVQRMLPGATAEETARLEAEAAAARTAWNAALAAAEDSLLDVYGDTLDRARLQALRA